MAENVLLAGDVDAIKEYVFETSFLPQIRGGSQLLIECERKISDHIKELEGKDSEIYCGGGSFLFEVPLGHENKLKRYIEETFLKDTNVSTVTVVSIRENPIHKDEMLPDGWASRIWKASASKSSEGSFGLHTILLSAKIKEAKQQKKSAPFVEALPFGKRCDCCGKRMVSEVVPLSQESIEILNVCKVCFTKDKEGRFRKGGIRGKFNKEFYDFIKSQYLTTHPPHDVENLIEGAKRGYIAFLYADGNNIGDRLSEANSKEDFKKFSKLLSKGTEESLFNALSSVCESALRVDEKEDRYWPFEIINIGGDDVTLLIQAGYAWEVAVQFLDNFEKFEWTDDFKNMTASCGIVIANENYPMKYLQKLAEGSLKRAKRKAKEDPANIKSAIDFLWLPNPVISERIEPLFGYYQRAYGYLTARPYTLDEAKNLLTLSNEALRRIPSTQRHLWGEALERGLNASVNAILYNVARQPDGERQKSMLNILSRVSDIIAPGSSQASQSLWSYRKFGNANHFCTALLDVLELAELLSMQGDLTKEVST